MENNSKHSIDSVTNIDVIRKTSMEQTPHLPYGHPLPQGARETTHIPKNSPKLTKPHHQNRTANMKQLSRSLRRNKTSQEAKLWRRLRNNQLGFKFYRQYVVNNKYIVDFVCLEKKLIIEVDGSQHAENESDQERTAELEKCGFQVVRFWNNQINQHLNECIEEIYQRLHGKIV